MVNVVVLLAPGFEEIEAVTPIDYLRRAGAAVTLAAIPVEGSAGLLVRGAHGISVQADLAFDEYLLSLDGQLPDAVFVPGGMPGASNVAACQPALDFIKKMDGQNKLVSAICAAPAVVLSKTGVLENKKWTCYPGMEKQAAEYCETADQSGGPFVADKNLITGRGPGAAEQFAMAIVERLFGKEKADQIKAGSVQR